MISQSGKHTSKAKGRSRAGARSLWIAGVAFAAVIILGFRLVAPQVDRGPADLRAALIDQLSPAFPNEEFRAGVTSDVASLKLPLDTYEGDDVDVGLYRSIGEQNYGVLVIRSHSGILELEGPDQDRITALFTNEPYRESRHVAEQLRDRVLIVRPFEDDPELTFGVTPHFFLYSMRGEFPRTVVVVAGCSILGRTDLAEALVSRGASVVISWDRSVGLAHADEATSLLVRHLLGQGMTVENAVVATMAESGPDPEFGATLKYYPVAAGRYTAGQLIGR